MTTQKVMFQYKKKDMGGKRGRRRVPKKTLLFTDLQFLERSSTWQEVSNIWSFQDSRKNQYNLTCAFRILKNSPRSVACENDAASCSAHLFHSFIQHTHLESLQRARHMSKNWGFNSEQNRPTSALRELTVWWVLQGWSQLYSPNCTAGQFWLEHKVGRTAVDNVGALPGPLRALCE